MASWEAAKMKVGSLPPEPSEWCSQLLCAVPVTLDRTAVRPIARQDGVASPDYAEGHRYALAAG